jgi:hypothetical protein
MIRKFEEKDFEEVKKLYQRFLNFSMSLEFYSYLYYHRGTYTSFVYEYKGVIIGHHAFIPYHQYINDLNYSVATLSGAVVHPEKSGLYLSLLKETIKQCNADFVVAFPNKNSHDFFTKLLNFKSIVNNYFSINAPIDDINMLIKTKVKLDDVCIEKRFNSHPKYNYIIEKIDDFTLVYKNYQSSIDILYFSSFDRHFIHFVNNKLKQIPTLNLIHNNSEEMDKLKFHSVENNIFVYKKLRDINVNEFPCQMFNSDVF